MENIVLLRKEDLIVFRDEIKQALNNKTFDFEKRLILSINEKVKVLVNVDNNENIYKETLYIKVFLDKPNDKKIRIFDLFSKIKENSIRLKEESNIINELSVKIKDQRYNGKNLLDGDKINEDVGKELSEMIFVIEIELSL